MLDRRGVVADLQTGFAQTELIVWVVGLPSGRAGKIIDGQFIVEAKPKRAENVKGQCVVGCAGQNSVAQFLGLGQPLGLLKFERLSQQHIVGLCARQWDRFRWAIFCCVIFGPG